MVFFSTCQREHKGTYPKPPNWGSLEAGCHIYCNSIVWRFGGDMMASPLNFRDIKLQKISHAQGGVLSRGHSAWFWPSFPLRRLLVELAFWRSAESFWNINHLAMLLTFPLVPIWLVNKKYGLEPLDCGIHLIPQSKKVQGLKWASNLSGAQKL